MKYWLRQLGHYPGHCHGSVYFHSSSLLMEDVKCNYCTDSDKILFLFIDFDGIGVNFEDFYVSSCLSLRGNPYFWMVWDDCVPVFKQTEWMNLKFVYQGWMVIGLYENRPSFTYPLKGAWDIMHVDGFFSLVMDVWFSVSSQIGLVSSSLVYWKLFLH